AVGDPDRAEALDDAAGLLADTDAGIKHLVRDDVDASHGAVAEVRHPRAVGTDEHLPRLLTDADGRLVLACRGAPVDQRDAVGVAVDDPRQLLAEPDAVRSAVDVNGHRVDG